MHIESFWQARAVGPGVAIWPATGAVPVVIGGGTLDDGGGVYGWALGAGCCGGGGSLLHARTETSAVDTRPIAKTAETFAMNSSKAAGSTGAPRGRTLSAALESVNQGRT